MTAEPRPLAGTLLPVPPAITLGQLRAAMGALGLDESAVLSLSWQPDRVGVLTVGLRVAVHQAGVRRRMEAVVDVPLVDDSPDAEQERRTADGSSR